MKPYCLWWVDQPLSNAQLAWQVEQMVRQGIERIAVGGVEEEAVLSRLEDALTGVGIEIVEMEEAVTFFEPWAHVQTLEAAKFAYIGASAANVPQQPIALLRAFLDRDMPLQPGLFYQSPQWPFFHGLLAVFTSLRAPVHEESRSSGRVHFLEQEDWHFTANGGNRVRMAWGEGDAFEVKFVLEEAVVGLRVLVQSVDEVVGLYLDGVLLEEVGGWEVDMGIRVFAVPADLALGEHRISIERDTGAVWLAGDFRADEHEDGIHLQPVRGVLEGAWEEQGFRNFSGCGTYVNMVEVPEFGPHERVEVDVLLCGGVLAVEVNGEDAGWCLCSPHRVDITPYVQPKAEILLALRCTNGLGNMLGGDEAPPSGLVQGVCFRVC